MVKLERILFLTDFSEAATQALAYARAVAERFGARLYVLHVIENPTHKLYGEVTGDFHAYDKNAWEKTQAWLAQLQREHLQGFPHCELLIERGELLEHVLRVIQHHLIDVVVLSAHTHRGFHLHLLANLPEKLVRWAPCHVLVIHSTS